MIVEVVAKYGIPENLSDLVSGTGSRKEDRCEQ
jgi:hypothetical protein